MAILGSRSERVDRRIPFFTPVATSRLSRCWATNLSPSGIGLAGYAVGSKPIAKGDELDLSFELGDTKHAVQVTGRVSWISVPRANGRLGLGVQFLEPSAATRGTLVRFVTEHRPRVLVAFASRDDQQMMGRTLAHLDLEYIGDPAEVDSDVVRTCAAVVLFGNDERRLGSTLEQLGALSTAATLPNELPFAPIILCTNLDSERVLPLFRAGKIYEVLRLPVSSQALALALERTCEHWALQLELRWASMQLEAQQLAPERVARTGKLANVIKVSPQMRRVYELIATVAVHDVPVLVTGETGTGKELAAREIHAQSRRRHTPFVAQDCGALTETLLESELFGHVRGAFTGATTDHPGLFQIAEGGTIFLDEIQNTSPALQAKLLRVIEEGEVRPVGGTRPRQVNVRLLAACNVDLRQVVKSGRFRSDFYYRINRFPIELPPLREHSEDIMPLVRFFLASLCETMTRQVPELDAGVEATLIAYDWPGNIRELRNAIERALLLTPPGEPLRAATLPDDVKIGGVAPKVTADRGLMEQLDEYERKLIRESLARHDGIIRRAARELAVNAVTLARRMRRLGLFDDADE
ncbi:MAG: sigma 54-interacting transcriptional regulator [Kofleriaceae bacterium]|nr:sigma 54-interacting transcriptional regulator [Kofleriaceae bacterium]